jgi:8-oxo-dGTP pyrophosphatase MutT (NUDIX family)
MIKLSMFKKLSHKVVYENKWMTVFEDEVEFPNTSQGIYGYVKRSDGAGALVVNQNQEVLLVKQYRYPVQDWQWGLPGGAIDPGETPEQSTRREVEEETGLKIINLEKLGQFYPLSSCSTEIDYLFIAHVAGDTSEFSSNQSDESFQEIKFVSMSEALEMIDSGEITDAFTGNALQMLARKLNQ